MDEQIFPSYMIVSDDDEVAGEVEILSRAALGGDRPVLPAPIMVGDYITVQDYDRSEYCSYRVRRVIHVINRDGTYLRTDVVTAPLLRN